MGKELYQLTKLLMFKNHIFLYFQSIHILDKDQLLSQSSHILLVCFFFCVSECPTFLHDQISGNIVAIYLK